MLTQRVRRSQCGTVNVPTAPKTRYVYIRHIRYDGPLALSVSIVEYCRSHPVDISIRLFWFLCQDRFL